MIERFSASVAGKHMACHASANLELAIPGWESPEVDETRAAAEGTSVHSIFEKVWDLTARDLHHFARTVQYVADLRSTRRFKVMIEQSITAEWLTTKPRTTADLVLYTQDEIHVLDTKWGKIPVEAVGNEQLLFYAACYAALAPKAKGVHLHILQPRSDNMTEWYVDTNEIAKFMQEAQAAERAIQGGDTSFGPSDHCKFCAANPHSRANKGHPLCPAMLNLLYPRPLDEDEILMGDD